jgi:DNA-binding IclR family transcriptional regulator
LAESGSNALSNAPPAGPATTRASETLQTLRRGIQILDLLSDFQDGLTLTQVATSLGIHRTIASRLLSTLQAHRLVVRDAAGRFWLGPGLSKYALSVAPRMREVALPELRRLAQEYPVTAVLTVIDGSEAAVLAVVEPATADFFVGIRVGTRHSLESAAGGLALLAGRAPAASDSEDVVLARRRGYAVSKGKVNQGALGVASPVGFGPEHMEGSIGVVTLVDLNPAKLGAEVALAANRVALALKNLS